MTSSRAVLGITVLVTVGLMAGASRDASLASAWVATVGNLVIPALWAAVILSTPRLQEPGVALAGTLVLLVALLGWRDGLTGACWAASGAAGGWAIARRWRVLPVLGLAAALLAPTMALQLEGASFVEAFEELHAESRRAFEESLGDGVSEADRRTVMANYDDTANALLVFQRRLWPGLAALAMLIQSALCLTLGWLLVRLWLRHPPRPAIRRWDTWRAPFISVWTLIGGLAAAILGVEPLAMVGWNLVLLAGLVLAIQGLAVQTWLVRRALPPAARVVFWMLGAFFLAPLLVGGGALIGLADQWLNLRRIEDPAAPQEDDET